MADWPVLYTEGRTERDRMASTHRPIPLPAYDVEGNLIDPSNCKQELAGAIVRILSHCPIGSSNRTAQTARTLHLRHQAHSLMQVPPVTSTHFISIHFASMPRLPLPYVHRLSSHLKNTFAADVKSIRVLVKPPPLSPNKRQTSQRDPDDFLSTEEDKLRSQEILSVNQIYSELSTSHCAPH